MLSQKLESGSIFPEAYALPESVGILLPKQDNEGNRFPESLTKKYILTFVKEFGGCTVEDKTGFWESSGGILFEDSITHIWSNVKSVSEETLDILWRIARIAKKEYRQESVSILVNGGLYII